MLQPRPESKTALFSSVQYRQLRTAADESSSWSEVFRAVIVLVTAFAFVVWTSVVMADGATIATTKDFRIEARAEAGTIERLDDMVIVRSSDESTEPWSIQMQTSPMPSSVKAGEAFSLSFSARCVEGPNDQFIEQPVGTLNVHMAKNDPYVPITATNGFRSIEVPANWQDYVICLAADRDFDGDQIYASIQMATQRQVIELRSVRLASLGSLPEDQWPVAPLHYVPASESWHAEARRRIAQHRQTDLTVRVVNAFGKPIVNASVDIQQQRHAYAFGTFVGDAPIGDTDDATRFRETTEAWFNRVTLPRYWADWGTDQPVGLVRADATAEWAYQAGFELKNHVLLYSKYIPDRVKALKSDPVAFRREIELAISETLRRTRTLNAAVWDGLNELRDGTLIGDVLGFPYHARVFNLASEAQPDAIWFLNEYGILTGGSQRASNLTTFVDHARTIRRDGGNIEGLGVQGHFQTNLISMPEVWSILDQLAEEGLPIEITEFDIDSRDEETQAIFTRDFLTAIFAHPATTGITTWGFWQGDMWRPNGAMMRTDWSLKPNGLTWRDLTLDQWWTRETLRTDSAGTIKLRAFLGEHQIRAAAGGYIRLANVSLTEPTTITLRVGTWDTDVKDQGSVLK
ncbi:MAG: endo-1,4-beta-xylanase [Planctomycetota bacterium]